MFRSPDHNPVSNLGKGPNQPYTPGAQHGFFNRGSIPAKVGFWVGLRIFSYVPTPTKLTNSISKTQLSGPKKGGFSPKIPRKCPLFCFWRVLAVFSGVKPAEWALHHFFVSWMLQIGEKKLPQELGKDNLTPSLTKSASIGYFPAFFAFISRYVMQFLKGYFRNKQPN